MAANYVKPITHELEILTMLTGKSYLQDLNKEDLRALIADTTMITGVKMIGIDRILP
ncbi:hypothetical protein J7L60_03310 [Candidatus Bathyarchaeota archaeon]|nr:hypothetical protein [Candidatus Bathyarchaeota archaeon]